MTALRKRYITTLLGIQLLLIPLTNIRAEGEIIFSDDFESGSLSDHWEDINSTRKGDVELETRVEDVFSGKRSLCLTAAENSGNASVGQVTHWFMPGYEQLYYRWYAKFAGDFNEGNLMHWTMIGGNSIYNMWSAFGKAGIRPAGTDFFTTSLEPWRNWGEYPPPGAMNFYTYYPDMTGSPDGKYWGNQFQPLVPYVIERGRWYCFEFMVKLNTPGLYDGEQAFWIDGVKIFHARNMRWRTVDYLKLNFFWFSVYIHEAHQDNTCWYDDLVISTDYVGPKNGLTPASPEDYDLNFDGKINVADAIILLRMKLYDPEDGRTDYNRDGKSAIADIIQLLIDILKNSFSGL
ncbi:MAG TPA: hypothetical protein VM123_19630 [archaeon]|nr:hypothetical protein [archaeon]